MSPTPRFTFLCVSLVVGLFVACQGRDMTPPHPPYRPNATCEESCTQLRTLGCKEGAPTPKGATCETVCADVNASGHARWASDCLVVARSCEEARSCR